MTDVSSPYKKKTGRTKHHLQSTGIGHAFFVQRDGVQKPLQMRAMDAGPATRREFSPSLSHPHTGCDCCQQRDEQHAANQLGGKSSVWPPICQNKQNKKMRGWSC